MKTKETSDWKIEFGKALKSLGLGMSGSQADFIFESVKHIRQQAIKEILEKVGKDVKETICPEKPYGDEEGYFYAGYNQSIRDLFYILASLKKKRKYDNRPKR